LEGSPRAPLRLKENIGRAENRDEALIPVRVEDPYATDFRRKCTRDAHSALEKNFPEALVELAKFVLFGQFDDEASHF
jgi:hypothetical protein